MVTKAQRAPIRAKTANSVPSRKHIYHEFLAGLCFSFVLFICGVAFEHTFVGEEFQNDTYWVLQMLLSSAGDIPVTIIDISQLGLQDGVTPRNVLKSLIGEILNYRPAVVGVDIDFSPEGGRFLTPADPQFFKFCLDQRVPIFLGISRTEAQTPAELLGIPEYERLAAAILVPKKDSRALTQSYGPFKIKTIGADLADTYDSRPLSWCPGWLCSRDLERDVQGLRVSEWLVDYSVLERLKDRSIEIPASAFREPHVLFEVIHQKRTEIEGRMVLIGDVESAVDVFAPQAGKVVSGTLLHASAAYTWGANPVFAVRDPWRTPADLVLALIILTCVCGARLMSSGKLNGDRLFAVLTTATIVLVIVSGFLAAHFRVLWDGFLLVALMLAVHLFAEKPSLEAWHLLVKWLHQKGR